MLNRNRHNSLKYVETWWAIGQGGLCVFFWLRSSGKCAHRVSAFSCAFPKVHHSVSIAEMVSNTLWAFPQRVISPFWYCSMCLQELLGAFPKVSQLRFGHFLYILYRYISLKAACFLFTKIKNRNVTDKSKNLQRFLLI